MLLSLDDWFVFLAAKVANDSRIVNRTEVVDRIVERLQSDVGTCDSDVVVRVCLFQPIERAVLAFLPVNIAELSPSAACARVPGIQQCGRVTAFLAPSPRWEPYALTRSYGSVRGAISDGRPYRDLTGENVSTRWLEAIKYPRQQTSLAVSMGRTLE